jgi:hypothetical protein
MNYNNRKAFGRLKASGQARSMRGQAIAEGTAMLIPLSFLFVAIILLVIGAGQNIYYRLKLAYIADAGARQAVQHLYWMGAPRTQPPDYQGAGEAAAKQITWLMSQTGMPTTNVSITPDFSDAQGAKVTISVSSLPISIPILTKITETAAEPYSLDTPPGYCKLAMWSQSSGTAGTQAEGIMYMPCFGAYTLDSANNPGVTTTAPSLPSNTTVWVAPYMVGQVSASNPSLSQSPAAQ